MKQEYFSLELIKNETDNRFEMTVDNQPAIIEYKEYPGKIALLHTEVPAALEGRGIATSIIEKTLDYIQKRELRLIPLCPMVAAYLKRHPEWNKLVEKQ